MKEREISKTALPMRFPFMKDLRNKLDRNMDVFKAIRFIINYGLKEQEDQDFKMTKLAPSFSNLVNFWMHDHNAIINSAIDEFERMDLVIINSAEASIMWAETVAKRKGEVPLNLKEETLRQLQKSIEDINLILQDQEHAQHDYAALLQAKCKNLMTKFSHQ